MVRYIGSLRPMPFTFYGYLIIICLCIIGFVVNWIWLSAYMILAGLIWVLLGPIIDSYRDNRM